MKKVLLGIGIMLVVLQCSTFAGATAGFQTGMYIGVVKDVTSPSTITMNYSTGIASINIAVNANYDGWKLSILGPGMFNPSQNHTLALDASVVSHDAAVGAYSALLTSPNMLQVKTGNYTGGAVQYDLYLRAANIAAAKAGYYGAYLELKFTDGY